ncbi:MAG TPA: hypothetical protein VEG27_10795 [Usitatibacter sp.]|nr:hypothetical protein [Usitatibacter sp.]
MARRIIAAVIGTVAVGLLALAAASIVPRAAPGTQAAPAQAEAASSPQQAAQSPDWGGEVLRNARDRAFAWAPFPVANACGIGASSCFKCHNGTRAIAPKDDKAKAPWHPDHQVVTDDCVGCHGGNPRIVRKDLAHNKLVANPLTSVDACTHCHKAGDAPALLKKYQQVASAGGK